MEELSKYRLLSYTLCSVLHSPVTSSFLGPNISEIILWISVTMLLWGSQTRWVQFGLITSVYPLIFKPKSMSVC
jgi:hypothetical protein